MKIWMVTVLAAMVLSLPVGAAQKETVSGVKSNTGLATARTICTITGVAMSPLLGTGAVGAYDWWTTPSNKRANLNWYAHPLFWVPALLLVGAVAAKDAAGTALPPGLKKPLDVAEVVENKISGVVAAGFFVPLVTMFMPSGGGTQAGDFAAAGFGAIHFGGIMNVLLTPLAMAAFALVWLACHAINVLILLSPWGVVDAGLKTARTFLMGLVTVTGFANPLAGAVLSILIILIAYFLAGWSLRLTVFGTVYAWDFITGRRHRFVPQTNSNWMFTARKIARTPIRTYGKLVREDGGKLTFEFRPWLILKKQTLTLPASNYAVGRGLFYPEIMSVEGEKTRTMLVLPPRYKSHEEEIQRAYGFAEVRDVGLLKGFKAIWNWLKGLFGFAPKPAPISA